MSKISSTNGDEIDLFELFQILWDGKWKIIAITTVAVLVAIIINFVIPNRYDASTPLNKASQSVFLPYTSLNFLLYKNPVLTPVPDDLKIDSSRDDLKIDSSSIFKMFVIHFNDYDEMIDVLSQNEYVKQTIEGLDEIEKINALAKFAESFKLNPPSSEEGVWSLSFKWFDDLEGANMFNQAIQQTLMNVQKTAKDNIDELIFAVETINLLDLESFRRELSVLEQKQKVRNDKQIQFLTEQSAIANELGITLNKLNPNALSQTSQSRVSVNVSSNVVPYYLRGTTVIDKEAALIKNRSENELLLMAQGYVEVKEKILTLENDLTSSQLKSASILLANDNSSDWVDYNFQLAKVESLNKPIVYIAFSIFMGVVVGVFYVLTLNSIRKRKKTRR